MYFNDGIKITSDNIGNNINSICCFEKYVNHLGSTDNFTQTETSGNGTASTDTANHKMDLSTGITNAGYSKFETKKSCNNINTLISNIIIDSIQNGIGGTRKTLIGFANDFSSSSTEGAFFLHDNDNNWYTIIKDNNNTYIKAISSPINDDNLSIIIKKNTDRKIGFYINGILIIEGIYGTFTSTLKCGGSVITTVGVTTERLISINSLNLEVIYN